MDFLTSGRAASPAVTHSLSFVVVAVTGEVLQQDVCCCSCCCLWFLSDPVQPFFSKKRHQKAKGCALVLKVIENKVINDLVVVERVSCVPPVKKMERQVSQN